MPSVWRQSIRSLLRDDSACVQVALVDAVAQPDGARRLFPVRRRRELDHWYGPPVGPKGVKERERDEDGDVRLNPLHYRLAELRREFFLKRTGAVWHYVAGVDGEIRVGTDEIKTVVN